MREVYGDLRKGIGRQCFKGRFNLAYKEYGENVWV